MIDEFVQSIATDPQSVSNPLHRHAKAGQFPDQFHPEEQSVLIQFQNTGCLICHLSPSDLQWMGHVASSYGIPGC